MRPQWEAGVRSGGQVKTAAAFPQKDPPPHTLPFHIFISLTHFSISCMRPPPAFSRALILSLAPSFFSTPPSDAAHVHSFVWQFPFITGLNGKSIYGAQALYADLCGHVSVSG